MWPDGEKYLVEAPWTYERIDGASHWLQIDAPDRLAALLENHWRRYGGA